MLASEIIETLEKMLGRSIKGKSFNDWYDSKAAKILDSADLKALELLNKNTKEEYDRREVKPDYKTPHFIELIPNIISIGIGFFVIYYFIWHSEGWTFIGDLISDHIAISPSLYKYASKLIPAFLIFFVVFMVINWIAKELIDLPNIAKNLKDKKAAEKEDPIRETLFHINRILSKIVDERTKKLLLKSEDLKKEYEILINEYTSEQEKWIFFVLLKTGQFDIDGAKKVLSKSPAEIILYTTESEMRNIGAELEKEGVSTKIIEEK